MVVVFSTTALPPCDITRFALSARRLAAVVPSLTLVPVPGSAPFVVGITRWRGGVVTAIDFRRDAATRDRDEEGWRWMLVHSTRALGSGLLALRVEPTIALHRATNENRQLLDRSKSSFLAGVFEIDREPVGFLQLGFLASVISGDRGVNTSITP